MKRSWAMKWARDLETTRAKQANGYLNDGKGGFCCLGRLCVVAGKRGIRSYGGEISYHDETGVLPVEVIEMVGMKTDNGVLPNKRALSELNDEGVSFREIAKIIRKNWKSL